MTQLPPDLAGSPFAPLACDERRWREQVVAARDGQGTFRLRLLQAYGSRCALTGERIRPPRNEDQRPSRDALAWHAEHKFS